MRSFMNLLLVPTLASTLVLPEEPEIDLSPAAGDDPTCSLENNNTGICVIYYLCHPLNRTLVTDGNVLLDFRDTNCPHYLDVCCQRNKIDVTRRKELSTLQQSVLIMLPDSLAAPPSTARPATSGASRIVVPTKGITYTWCFLTYLFFSGITRSIKLGLW